MARPSPSAASASELTPLLPRDDVRLTVSPVSHLPSFRLPRWFVAAMILSVLCSAAWLVLLLLAPRLHLHVDASMYLYAGVLNSLLGSFLSASGYCCQKYAHLRVARNSSLGTATMQTAFLAGLFLLAVGTISAVVNLGILGQAVQAPFAALTLIYSALLGRFVLHESFGVYDLLSSALIILGVGVDVYAAQLADVPQQSYTLQSLGRLLTRNSVFPLGYSVGALAYAMLLLRRVHTDKLQRHPIGLLAFSSCAGVMAGFTSLATKSAVEVAKSALKDQAWLVFVNPFFLLLVLAIPCALVPQLFFLNKGLEFFGTLKFIPLYQAFIIIGNMGCGMIFYNEMASYSSAALTYFVGGILITICGVCVLLVKVDADNSSADGRRYNVVKAVDRPMDELLDHQSKDKERFETDFTLGQMKWATDSDGPSKTALRVCRDFRECQEAIVDLLVSARKSIYYSTFLCDFTQVLHTQNEEHMDQTFVSLVRDAVKRGVDVHILYNPVRDYGTNSIADLRLILPPEVHFACSVSDLGPSWFTRYLSNNSRYAFHHQKYLCIDEETLMVTGCDVNTEREGWLRKNHLGYYWHELSVVCRCTAEMMRWIHANHKPADKKRYYDQFMESPPFPLVSGGWREENCMVNMIMNAKHSVQLESQIMISGGSLQHNRICPAIVARISQAVRKGESFHALILTNAAQKDEPSFLARTYCTLSIQWSLEQLEDCALAYGLTLDELWQHLQVGRLEHDGVLIKVHSNILIVDGEYALRSSSNLADRSLSARPNDTELGLLFSGPRVKELQQDLLNMYLCTTGQTYSWGQVFERIRGTATEKPTGVIKPLEKKTWSPVFTWFMMNVFIYLSEGATGGRVKVTYETSVIGEDKHEFET
jgi:phosphatidylserine/phosphatidylglycerophosphate/cardiolipin synthase-like enzyme/drug/metabolite transporter (DMT)-like permease